MGKTYTYDEVLDRLNKFEALGYEPDQLKEIIADRDSITNRLEELEERVNSLSEGVHTMFDYQIGINSQFMRLLGIDISKGEEK